LQTQKNRVKRQRKRMDPLDICQIIPAIGLGYSHPSEEIA